MIGAIFGDIVGSVHERARTKTTDFPLFVAGSHFTDDTVLTIATAEALFTGKAYDVVYRDWARRYPHAGYGGTFKKWFRDRGMGPYESFGNGSAMRVSPVAYAFDTAEEVLAEAERSAEVTHNHPEGIKGAQAAALAVFRARKGVSKPDIRKEITERFGYDLSRSVRKIRAVYRFDVSCQGSVPEALIAFLDTPNLEKAIRTAISFGGDADTQAAIAGAAAAAFDGGVAPEFVYECRRRLPADMIDVLDEFESRFPGPNAG